MLYPRAFSFMLWPLYGRALSRLKQLTSWNTRADLMDFASGYARKSDFSAEKMKLCHSVSCIVCLKMAISRRDSRTHYCILYRCSSTSRGVQSNTGKHSAVLAATTRFAHDPISSNLRKNRRTTNSRITITIDSHFRFVHWVTRF